MISRLVMVFRFQWNKPVGAGLGIGVLKIVVSCTAEATTKTFVAFDSKVSYFIVQ